MKALGVSDKRFRVLCWRQKREELYAVFQRNPEQGTNDWLKAYAEAIIGWDLEICSELANEPFPFPIHAAELQSRFQDSSKALSDGNYAEALDMLAYLTEVKSETEAQFLLDPMTRASLLVLLGRIYLFVKIDREVALNIFKQAIELSPNKGLPHAAMADYYRNVSDQNQAIKYYQQAIQLSPKQFDGYLGMALLCRERQAWNEAREWYLRAVQANLREPGSPDQTQALSYEDIDHMLEVATQTIKLEYNSETNYREGIEYELKGLILETLHRRMEAAEAYYEAGRRFGWAGEPQCAIELLAMANQLNPAHVPTHWNLADAWRIQSYLAEPPYVDKTSIEKSLEIWETGFGIQPPDANNSWAYVIRALINEQLARLPNADRWTLWWESVTYLERAILLSEWDVYRWAYLGRFHRYLATESVALEATLKALEYGPNEFVALDERAAILANVGQFEEAKTTIDRRRELQPSSWADGLKAYVLLHEGQYQSALDLINNGVTAEPDNIWSRNLRADSFLMLGDPAQAAEDYRWIWDRCDPADIDNQGAFGWAAFNLGKIDDAVTIFSRLLNDPIQAGFAYRGLGICQLSQGNLEGGEDNLDKGISLAINVREIDDLLTFDLKRLEELFASLRHDDDLHVVLARLNERIKKRRREVERRRSAAEELQQLATQLGEKHSWPWIAVQAGLARLSLENKQWSEATKTYRQLLEKEPNRFPEARLGLERITHGLQSEGDSLRDQPSAALEKYNGALEITLQLPLADPRPQAELHSRFGYIHLRLQNISETRRHFIRAAQLYRHGNEEQAGRALGSVCRSLLRNSSEYWQLHDELSALADDAIDTQLQKDLVKARESLKRYLDESYELFTYSWESSNLLPVVTPIVVEIGADLIPEGPERDWDLFNAYLPKMRDVISKNMGVQVPGIRIRANDDGLFAGQYTIMIDEVPVANGSVNGRNLELSPDALAYVVNRLEVVLRRNLADFLGIQEVENLLATWSQTEPGKSLIEDTLSKQISRLCFARVLRALVKERVPIKQWQSILEVIKEIGLPNQDITEAVRDVRLRLKDVLPGNNQHSIRVELPWPIEDKLVKWLSNKGGKTFFALPNKVAQEALSGIRNVIGRNKDNVVLVIRSGKLRPFIRRLVEFEFPDVMVLSQDELSWPVTASQISGMG